MGQTQGRGRQDRYTEREKTIKDIYVYALEKDFRQQVMWQDYRQLHLMCEGFALGGLEGMPG